MTAKELDGLQQLNELKLSEEETSAMISIFDRMYECERAMDGFDTNGVEIMVHAMPLTNVFREDVREQGFSRESLLEGAPEHTADSWQVPRLVK